ncbi:MAG: tRNA (adenosine(37)-N6)-threonylcarbamoyltransferase complex dimerization subunit type 1 TsaB [Candidatus Omnitrophica bacterium]|nr:tRNA (adenosine(37)-N6)-threonylcarbamoyltransferase complex dimerization subunit type 1 TsaB [Candidatus Omnitrophota bacterium]
MKTIAIDTSTRYMSIALLEGERTKLEHHEDAGIRHSEILVPTIKRMVDEVAWKLKDVDLFALGIGPGSFTGLRISAAAVKAFALFLPARVVGVPSIDAIAHNAPAGHRFVAPFLDAYKGKVYTCLYGSSEGLVRRIGEPALVEARVFLAGLKNEVFFFGDGTTKYAQELENCPLAGYDKAIDWHPRAATIGLLGIRRANMGNVDDPEALDPLYLHPKECDVSEEVLRKIKEKKA